MSYYFIERDVTSNQKLFLEGPKEVFNFQMVIFGYSLALCFLNYFFQGYFSKLLKTKLFNGLIILVIAVIQVLSLYVLFELTPKSIIQIEGISQFADLRMYYYVFLKSFFSVTIISFIILKTIEQVSFRNKNV